MTSQNDDDLKNRERRKKIAILKASNELLEESKRKVFDNQKISEDEKRARIKDIEEAQNYNIKTAKSTYNATQEEMMSTVYSEVSQQYVDEYNERLKERGLTDEEVRRKNIAVAINDSENGKTTKRRRSRRKEKEGDSLEDKMSVATERTIMESTRISDNANMDNFIKEKERERITEMTKPVDNVAAAIADDISSKKITETKVEELPVDVSKRKKKVVEKKDTSYDFDFSSIPANVQYDMIPLPSKGECYPHKRSRIPVAYLTAADESLISSPNMYRDNKVIDVILRRKVLDKSINVDELCKGDRDAIILWLRATGYGVDFPIVATHPVTRKKHEVVVKLDSFKYFDFDLKGDENGHFEYTTENGDVLKYKVYTNVEQEELRHISRKEIAGLGVFDLQKCASLIESCVEDMNNLSTPQKGDLNSIVEDLRDIVTEIKEDNNIVDDEFYSELALKQIVMQTMAVNGDYDREHVKSYVENMRAGDARKYRTFISNHAPGVDMTVTVSLPQEEGGTFSTFLGFDDTVFLNV